MYKPLYFIGYLILSVVGFSVGMACGLVVLEAAELSMFSFLSFGTGAAGTWYGTAILNNFRKCLRLRRIHAIKTGKTTPVEDTLWAAGAAMADILFRPILAALSALLVIMAIGASPAGVIGGIFVSVFAWAFIGSVIDSIWSVTQLEREAERVGVMGRRR